jgi:glycosyltransferase involved in cell wall biosynthesis
VHAVPPGLFSIVIPTLNEGGLLAMTTNSILSGTAYPDFEIIVVDDGSTDDSTGFYERYPNPRVKVVHTNGQGVARARNLGAAHASGDYLVFIDGHCRVSPNWLDAFRDTLDLPDIGVAGPSFTKLETPVPRGAGMYWADYTLENNWYEPIDGIGPYIVPLTTGACQAFRRATFFEMGQYQSGFTRWGYEDVEICLRAWALGYKVVVHPAVTIAHYFRESRAYDVSDVDVTYNFLRMLHMHFDPERIERAIASLGANPYVPPALEKIKASDVFDVRRGLDAARVRDDRWFFRYVNQELR